MECVILQSCCVPCCVRRTAILYGPNIILLGYPKGITDEHTDSKVTVLYTLSKINKELNRRGR